MSDGVTARIGNAPLDDDSPETAPVDTESHENTDGGEHTESGPEAKETTTLAPTMLTSGAMVHGKIITINCVDCGVKRTIKPQDVFQVKRCLDCQKKFRNAQRSEKRKVKRQEAKDIPQ
jgi:DNA-directed RNA polymerase subunit RPC12/RpoP